MDEPLLVLERHKNIIANKALGSKTEAPPQATASAVDWPQEKKAISVVITITNA